MAFRDFLMGSPQRFEQAQRFTDPQQQGLAQILQQALGGLKDTRAGFAPIAQQARTQFEQQTIPGIASRFSGLDAQGSSGFRQALGQAGAGLEQGLASQGAQYGLQQQGLLQQLLGMGLTPQFENLMFERDPGFIRQAGTAFAGGLGEAIPGALTGGTSSLLTMLQKLLGQKGQGQQTAQFGRPTAQPQPMQPIPYQQPTYAPYSGLQTTGGGDQMANLRMLLGGF